jgi:hypothetical protein
MKAKNLVTILVLCVVLLSLVGCSTYTPVRQDKLEVYPVTDNSNISGAYIVRDGYIWFCYYASGNVHVKRLDLTY